MYVVNAYSKTVSVINGANIGNVTLTFPTNNADNVLLRPTLRWNAATYATAYNVQVSTNSAFDMNTITIDSRSVSDTLTVFLNAGTKYYWRVAGTHGSSTGSWTTDSFTTAQIAPSAPILASPANGAIDVDLNPRLIWNAGPDATTYHVQLSNTSSFSFAKDTAGNGYTCALKSLTPYTTYYWRVNVSNFYGTSPWSAVDSFTTVASEPPSIPVLNTPSNGSSTPTNPGLTWNSCNYASTYEVQVSNSSTFSIIMDTVERGTSWKLVPLPVRSTYYWRVRASNAIGTSSWSSVWNFTTTNAGISDNKKPQYTGAAIGYSGILAIYSINGKRVMQMSFEATATKARLLKDAVKSLAKGAYVYRLNKNGEIVSQANMFVQ
jgi:hypothetical protein